MYKDPSVGNLINIMVVKLVIIHNEQVSPGVLNASCMKVFSVTDVIAGVWLGLLSVGPV